MLDNVYAMSRELPNLDHDDAVDRVVEVLEREDFGILTEIDVKETLRKKLDLEYPRYVILGTCNPPLAHRALSADLGIGVLLPCNVVITERKGGGSVVSVIDPVAVFGLVENPNVETVAREVRDRMRRVLDRLADGPSQSRTGSSETGTEPTNDLHAV